MKFKPEHALCAATIATFAALVASGELLARRLDPRYLSRQRAAGFQDLHRYSERYGWDLRPGSARVEDGARTTVNSLGYRGAEVALPRSASGATRVLLLGDSIAFGTYVGDGETFADRLARDAPFEVVNLAVQGYGPGQSLIKLEHDGLAYAPDVVVFNLCLANDFADAVLPVSLYDGRHPKPFYELQNGRLVLRDSHVRLSAIQRLGLALREGSHLYNRLAGLLPDSTVSADQGGHWIERRAAALRDERAAIELTARIVARMREVALANGAGFLLVVHPDKPSFAHDSPWADRLFASPELKDVAALDLRVEYRRLGLRYRDLMLDGIGHLSRAGHENAARILAAALRAGQQPAAELRPVAARGGEIERDVEADGAPLG